MTEAQTVRQKKIVYATADVTLTKAQSGSRISNLGAAGVVVVTLPPTAEDGDYFEFALQVAQELRIKPGTGNAFYIGGAKQTDAKYISADDEGESVIVVRDKNGDWSTGPINGTWSVES